MVFLFLFLPSRRQLLYDDLQVVVHIWCGRTRYSYFVNKRFDGFSDADDDDNNDYTVLERIFDYFAKTKKRKETFEGKNREGRFRYHPVRPKRKCLADD